MATPRKGAPVHGPVPKRTDQRRRTNNENGQTSVSKAPGSPRAEAPAPLATWHPIAAQWYASLAASGQSVFYEPSDWAAAFYIAEGMSRSLANEVRISSQMFAAVMSGMAELLTTEGSRRRARIELEKAGAGSARAEYAASVVTDIRARLSGA